MGLDTTHDCWQGSCRTFNDFRRAFAKTINMNLDHMYGFYVKEEANSINFMNDDLPVYWENVPKDDLLILLNHSDCDGIIENKDCLPLATRMQELLPQITDSYFKNKAEQFIKGLLDAHHAGEDVEFH